MTAPHPLQKRIHEILLSKTVCSKNCCSLPLSFRKFETAVAQQTSVYPYPLGAGSARPNPKMGAPDPENPLFLGFSALGGGLRPWSQTMVSEGARPWGRGRSGDCEWLFPGSVRGVREENSGKVPGVPNPGRREKTPTPKTRFSIRTLLRTPGRFTTRPLPVYLTTKMSVVRPFSVLSKDEIGP